MTVEGNDRTTINLTAIPLNTIYGHVYHDVNGNGRFDAGEGREKVVIHLDDQVTGTDADGAYGFYNLGPGKYTLRLDTERLEPAYVSSSDSQLVVDLAAGSPVTGADFRIAPRQRPLILRESPR